MAFTKPALQVSLLSVVLTLSFVLTLSLLGCKPSVHQAELTRFAFSPDGTSLLAVVAAPNASFLYKVALDSGKATRLTNTTSGFEGGANYSPDGKRIVFSYSANKDAQSSIMIANADGSGVRRLTSEGSDFFPVFLPDNQTVVFGRSAFFGRYSPAATAHLHEWDLYSVDDKGEHLQRLTKEALYDMSPLCLSPDGKLLMFTTMEGISIRPLANPATPVMVLRPEVPNHPATPVFGEAKFLDSKNILFLAASQGTKIYDYDVYRMNLEMKKPERLTTGNGYSTDLQVSPNGRTAIFVKWKLNWNRQPVGSDVVLLDLTTGTTRTLEVKGLPPAQS
jgi:Tol biopolymer transport system component